MQQLVPMRYIPLSSRTAFAVGDRWNSRECATTCTMSDSGLPPARRLWERIERERQERGWTTLELEKRSGVLRQTVNRWKTAKKSPLAESVNSLADAFGIPRAELLALVGSASVKRASHEEVTVPMPIVDIATVQGDAETEELLSRLSPRRRKLLEEFRESERARLARLAEDAVREAHEANARFAELVRIQADETDKSEP